MLCSGYAIMVVVITMIRRDKKKFKDGSVKTYIRVTQGYRSGPTKATKQRTIKSFGYVEDQSDLDSFWADVHACNAAVTTDEENERTIRLSASAQMYEDGSGILNYGYVFLESFYNLLQIDEYVNAYKASVNFKGKYDLNGILKFLVITRIMMPDSKRATFAIKHKFYDFETTFELEDIYRSMDHIAKMHLGLQKHMSDQIRNAIGRDVEFVFCDLTNYFTTIDFNDSDDGEHGRLMEQPDGTMMLEKYRKKGVSKEQRTDPIVQMGLFLDGNGIPLGMSLFPGNTSDSKAFKPMVDDAKDAFGTEKVVVVADKGVNTAANINLLVLSGHGYLVSQIIKGTRGKKYQKDLFDESGWEFTPGGEIKYKRIEEEIVVGKDKDGCDIKHKRAVLFYWSEKQANRQKRKRNEKLEKAEKSANNNVYTAKKGADTYIQEHIIDIQTGEVLGKQVAKHMVVDHDKADKDERYDGYACIITSELSFTSPEIIRMYGGLWEIEESFKILKSEFDARPMYVSTSTHIEAHFLVCYVALTIVRLMQLKLGKQTLSVERIKRALNHTVCERYQGGIMNLHDVQGAIQFEKRKNKDGKIVEMLTASEKDEIREDYKTIQQAFGVEYYYKHPKQENFEKFLNEVRQSTTKNKR